MANHYGYIKNPENFNPDNPEIVVIGLCTCSLQFARERAKYFLKQAIRDIDNKNADAIKYILLDETASGYCYIKAIEEVERDLNSPAMKRKITLMRQRKK